MGCVECQLFFFTILSLLLRMNFISKQVQSSGLKLGIYFSKAERFKNRLGSLSILLINIYLNLKILEFVSPKLMFKFLFPKTICTSDFRNYFLSIYSFQSSCILASSIHILFLEGSDPITWNCNKNRISVED